MQIAVVILNWNKAELTLRCLELAQRSTALPVHWILVDNGSSQPLCRPQSDVTLLRNEENLGFAGGMNVGLRHAFSTGADYTWLLNNDAEPLAGALDALIRRASAEPHIGLASPVILDPNLGDAIDWHGSRVELGDYISTRDPAEYQRWLKNFPDRICLVGTALLVTRRLIETVGYFDESLFAYWEDTDLSRRSLKAGLRNIVIPEAFVRHVGAPIGSGSRPPYFSYYMTRNQLLLSRKHHDPVRSYYWALRRIARWYRKPGLSVMERKAIRNGLLHGLLGISGCY